MKNVLWGAALAIVLAPAAANATTFPVGSPNFFVTSGTPFSPSITAIFFNSFSVGTTMTNFDDSFTFTIPQNGVGSGSISTSFSSTANKLVITDLIINGTHFAVPAGSGGQSTSVGGIPIVNGVLNTIEVVGWVIGDNGYSGTATFTAQVPEAATWGMMVGGFALMGAAMRRRKTAVSFS